MALESSADKPLPVRTVATAIASWIGKLGRIWVDGQVAELARRGTTCYLVLRDPAADVSLNVIASRQMIDAVSPPLTDGARVAIWAQPDFYLARGRLSLRAFEIRPVGVGELLARLEHLKGVLAAEGLFAAERKRPLPFLPRTIGLVCGRGSAAERDVVENARRRWPSARFQIENVAVQGPRAVPEVVAAIKALDADPQVDVIVVTRGGGSVEDLLPFSDEALVRAVSDAFTPIVSAIGHEQDAPLLDLVADYRASTPTDAGKRVVPDVLEESSRIRGLRERTWQALVVRLQREQGWLDDVRSRPALAAPHREIDRRADEVADWQGRLRGVLTTTLDRAGDDVDHMLARVTALSPVATLDRGYAIVQGAGGAVVRRADEAMPGDALTVRLTDGRLGVEVTRVDAATAMAPKP